MLNPLKIASGGYLKRTTKAVLIIAVAGYLNYTTPVIPNKFPGVVQPISSGSTLVINRQFELRDIDRLKRDDEELLLFIKKWLECQG